MANDEMEPNGGIETNGVFLSTQIQGRLEDWELEECKMSNIQLKMTSLKEMYLVPEVVTKKVPKGVTKRAKGASKEKATKVKKISDKKVKRTRKLKSVTAHVSEQHRNRCNAILNLLSGNKRKADDILQRILSIELNKSESQLDMEPQLSPRMVYDKDEWIRLVKKISLKFPRLSTPSKTTLKVITNKYLQGTLQSAGSSDKGESLQNSTPKVSLWDLASSHPSESFSQDELKWLYDLNEDDNPTTLERSFVESETENVLNLSQILNIESSFIIENDLEIPDSQPEEETLISEKISNHQQVQNISMGSVKPGISQKNAISLSSEPDTDFPMFVNASTEELPIPITKLRIQIPKSFSERAAGFEVAKTFQKEVVISSPPGSSSPELSSIENDIVVLSESTKPNHHFDRESESDIVVLQENTPVLPTETFDSSVNDAQVQRVGIDIDNDDESSLRTVYSTARSQLYYTQEQDLPSLKRQPTSNLKDNKFEVAVRGRLRYSKPHRTVIVKKGALNSISTSTKSQPYHSDIALSSEENEEIENEVTVITSKVVEVRQRPTDYDEVPNSSSEDEDEISIIEVIREIKHDKEDPKLIEVPSSQKLNSSLPSLDNRVLENSFHGNDNDNFTSTLNEVLEVNSDDEEPQIEDFSHLTHEELKSRLNSWGLKAGRGRKKMIETLSQASKLILLSQNSQSKDIGDVVLASQNSQSLASQMVSNQVGGASKTLIFKRITHIIKQDNELHKRLLTYDPIKLAELHKFLESHDVKLESSLIREYCDWSCVTLVGGDVEKNNDT